MLVNVTSSHKVSLKSSMCGDMNYLNVSYSEKGSLAFIFRRSKTDSKVHDNLLLTLFIYIRIFSIFMAMSII